MNGDKIRWGIIGCGDVTEVKSGPALQKAGRSELVAVMRRDAAKAQDYAARHSVPDWHSSAQELIDNPAVNAIYIATPPDSHLDLAKLAFDAGKPVLMEKPMGRDTAECDQMIADAAAAEQPLIIAYYRRALPRFEKMRSLIAGGAVGQPRLVQITDYRAHTARPQDDWRVNPTLSGGGIFFDTQSHTIDWLGYTFGKPSRIRGITARQAEGYAAEDFVAFTGLFGEVATVATCAYALGQDREEVTVLGDKGSISMSFFAHSPLRLRRADGRNELIEIADPEHMHQPFIERVVSYLLDGTKNPCSGAEARQVNAVLSDIY